jgi:hypothetical protein
MSQPVSVTITLLLLAAAIAGMGLSWRRRRRGQRGLALPAAPAGAGDVVATAEALHLATTFAGRPLDRVVVAGLGFRARALLTAGDAGVLLERDGADPFVIPAARISGVGTATWTLDRGVEPDGLTVLAWSLDSAGGPVPVESSFRIEPEPRAAFLAAVQALIAAPSAPEVPHADT